LLPLQPRDSVGVIPNRFSSTLKSN
jgi:hypothetical protein